MLDVPGEQNARMNQYDFIPPSPDDIRRMKSVVHALLLFIAALLIISLASCHEQRDAPTLSDRLEGYWTGGAWNHPDNLYYFHSGAAWAAKAGTGALTDRKEYAYSESGDTLKMLDVLTFERSDFIVEFPTDSTATLERVGGLKVELTRI